MAGDNHQERAGIPLTWQDGEGHTSSHGIATQAILGVGADILDNERRNASREEWTDEATEVVLEIWGAKHLELDRGKLRKQDWDWVADQLTRRVGTSAGTKTWLQCKNKIDSIKKKYKIVHHQRINGTAKKRWRLFDKVHLLLNTEVEAKTDDSDEGDEVEGDDIEAPILHVPQPVSQGQTAAGAVNSLLMKNNKRKRNNPTKELAAVIKEFATCYEKVELSRQERWAEIEQQKLAFWRDIEVQRMHVQLEIAKLYSNRPCCHGNPNISEVNPTNLQAEMGPTSGNQGFMSGHPSNINR